MSLDDPVLAAENLRRRLADDHDTDGGPQVARESTGKAQG